MAVTLIVNPGSTSRKYALYNDGVCITTFFFEETGNGFCVSVVHNGVQVREKKITATEFSQALTKTAEYALELGDIESIQDIKGVGIRVVAPGSYFTEHKIIDTIYIQKLEEVEAVAPLHIPGLLLEIQECKKTLPGVEVCGVSDSAFHTTIPEHVSTISIPRADAQKYDIKRFGYHGLSFASVARRLEDTFGDMPKRTIVCHVGGGVSIAALQDGKSIATSMGYSPASGMIMGSRGGDVTGGVVAALTIKKRLHGKKLYEYLYKEAGFKGVAGVRDLRLVLERAASGEHDAQLAVDMFVHQTHSWIGGHAVHLGGIDTIVLTATASVRNPKIRSLILSNLSMLGVEIDEEKNETLVGKEGFIHAENSKVKIAVMKTDEMGEIETVCRSRVV